MLLEMIYSWPQDCGVMIGGWGQPTCVSRLLGMTGESLVCRLLGTGESQMKGRVQEEVGGAGGRDLSNREEAEATDLGLWAMYSDWIVLVQPAGHRRISNGSWGSLVSSQTGNSGDNKGQYGLPGSLGQVTGGSLLCSQLSRGNSQREGRGPW